MKKILINIVVGNLLLCSSLPLSAQHSWTRTNPGGGGTIATVGATKSGILITAADLSGIYRSRDDGKHWEALGANQGIEETDAIAVGFHPTDGNTFFVGTSGGAYKTSDGGDHFSLVLGDTNVSSITLAKSNPDIGYITYQENWNEDWVYAPGEVYKTLDGGNSWSPVAGENLPDNLHLLKIITHPTNENIVYVLTGKPRFGCSPAHLYKSIDGGVHWSRLGENLGDVLDMDLHPSNINIVYLSTFKVNPDITCTLKGDVNQDNYLGGDKDNPGTLYKSTNGGGIF